MPATPTPFNPPMQLAEPAFSLPEGHKVEPAFAPHYSAWKSDPTPARMTTLLKTVEPAIASGIRSFGGSDHPLIRSRARRIAIGAIQSYDPTQAGLKTHLLNNLKGLQRHAARQTLVLNVPERVAIDKKNLDAAEAEMKDELGRDPSSHELAQRTGLSLKRMGHIRGFRGAMVQGQAERGFAEEGGVSDPAVEGPDPTLRRLHFLYPDLDPIDQVIVDHAFGLHGRPQLKAGEIARRVNRSPGLISQRSARIQTMLDELEGAEIL